MLKITIKEKIYSVTSIYRKQLITKGNNISYGLMAGEVKIVNNLSTVNIHMTVWLCIVSCTIELVKDAFGQFFGMILNIGLLSFSVSSWTDFHTFAPVNLMLNFP